MSKSFLDIDGLAYLVAKIKTMLSGKAPASHVTDTDNPHNVTKSQVGLGAVDNTSDADKPVSTAQASAIADAKKAGTDAQAALTSHNTDTAAHNDLRLELKALSERIAAVLDSDDETLDELSEIVAYIKSNKELIEAITTSKVSVSDIVNDLITNVTDKPLSAAQGVALKKLIDDLATQLSEAGGKRTTRFTVGTSANGWTAADCDYLCNGTDDNYKINNAINALPSTGGEVVLLDGTYTITGAINLNKANVTLRGNGSSTKLVRNFTGSDASPAAVFMTGANCVVRDIAIDGVKETYTYKSLGLGIKSTGENNTIEGCYIFNHAGDSIYIVANHNIVVGNITKSNYNGIEIEGNHNVIKGNINTDNTEDGVHLVNANYNTIIGNVFRTSGEDNVYMDESYYNIVTGNNCAVLDTDEVSPSTCIFISSGDENIVFDNILGTGSLVDWGENNDVGTAVPNTRTINGKVLSADITLSASDVSAAPSGYGLGSALPGKTITNCDDAIQTGWYKVSAGSTNAPVDTEFLLRCEMSSVYTGVQTAIVDTGNVTIKVRGRNGAVWGEWKDANQELTSEPWIFTLEDGSTVTKAVYVG